ncbi:MAG TPA: amylo-alpha-1,6-glucosidase [Nitrososphaeraceae archaeon]|jgi:GH15 family glucan-1,4-alpha-glucosidase|nr:amylo-alpha-1,6-glucosidase [Nitrososphaeraceae archaeon]
MARTLDKTHTLLSYIEGSLRNVTIVTGEDKYNGFIFSLLNPPVPLGGNVVSLDIYVNEMPYPKKSIFVATTEDMINAASISENRPLPFRPFQSARFLVMSKEGLPQGKKHKIVILSKLEGFEQIIIPFTLNDYVGEQREKILIPSNILEDLIYDTNNEDTIFKNFTSPLILSGKKAYIVCSSNGSISANWTWMGARYDNGGLYVPPVRAFGRIIVELSIEDQVRKKLPNFVASSRHEKGVLSTRHELAGIQVKRKLFVPNERKGCITILELIERSIDLPRLSPRKRSLNTRRKVRIHFIIDGNITSYGLAAISQSNSSRFIENENCLQVQTAARKGIAHYYGTIGIAPKELKPSRILVDTFDNDLELSYDIEIPAGGTSEIALIAAGSFNSSKECLDEFQTIRDNYKLLLQETQDHFDLSISSNMLDIQPNSKQNPTIVKIAKAFEKAKTGMEYLKAEYDALGPGICAGLPRFPNYWARDTGWSLKGYLALGDYEFVLSVLENFLRHQARRTTRTTIKGELPMIISGKAFLHSTTYGSADSTFLFPWSIREYVYSTGDISYLKKRWNNIVDLINCGFSKDIDGDGLIEHGFTGVAEILPIQDSTWMDHIDRRKSANDVQALFYESLHIGIDLAKIMDDKLHLKKWEKGALNLKQKIESEYWDNKEGFYFDTIRRDGTKDSSIRPNALVLLLAGITDVKTRAESVLRRIEKSDITTPWGVRTLSSLDPKYHPSLYHDGAIWPLVTGWAAAVETKYGRKEQALYYIESMAERILSENGMFAETYRGDRPEPFNSCILQAWSLAMYVYAVRELFLGMNINLIDNQISFDPRVPDSIRSNSVPIRFHHKFHLGGSRQDSEIVLDPYRETVRVEFRNLPNQQVFRPEITSNTYSVDIGK